MCPNAAHNYDSLKITYERRLDTAAIDKPVADMPLPSTSETTFCSYLQDVAKLAERSCAAYVGWMQRLYT